MSQAKSQPMTAEQLLQRSSELGRCELIKGELIEMVPPGRPHGVLAVRIAAPMHNFVENHDFGEVMVESGYLLARNPDTVRSADVAFLSRERGVESDALFFEGPPDLAVEVVSPNDIASDVASKVEDWLHHGAQLVWVVDPKPRTLTAYSPDHTARIYHRDETVPGEPVLPGFSLSLSQVFPAKAEMTRERKTWRQSMRTYF